MSREPVYGVSLRGRGILSQREHILSLEVSPKDHLNNICNLYFLKILETYHRPCIVCEVFIITII